MVAVVYPSPYATIVEDNDYRFVVYPNPSLWTLDDNATTYTGLSYHLTYVQGATVEFTFAGTEVWFYADRNYDHGMFSAVIDDRNETIVNGFGTLETQIPLFSAKVSPGTHTLRLKNLDNNKALGIDYFAFIPLTPFPSGGASNSTTLSGPSASPSLTTTPTIVPGSAPPVIDTSNSNKLATGAVVGIALGTMGIVIFLALGVLVWRDRRKQRTRRTKPFEGDDETTADPWIYNHPPPSPFLSPHGGSPAFNFNAHAPTPSSGKGGMVFVPMANLEGDLDGRRPQSLYSIEPPDSDVQSNGVAGAGGYAAGPSGTNDPRYFSRSDYSPSSNAPTRSAW